jgi:ATP-dependent RNA helicase SUPV3L1/SUV3
LDHAARDDDIRALAKTREAVERLWDVCQVPDYRKISPATHAELATTLYGFLMREGTIPTDWFARQIEQASHTDGDIDTLSNRIAHIRTWTFAANRPDWLADPEHWQDVTRAVEDKLSDALHERLTERFVDRRTSVLMRRLRENTVLETDISKSGDVMVEGHAIGRLDGFMFTPDASTAGSEAKALAGAAQKALAGEIDARATRLAHAADGQFVLATNSTIRWLGQPVGRLVAGEEVLKPRLRIIADEHLTGAQRDAVQGRLDLWLKSHIERLLEGLFRLAAADDITGIARGLAFQLTEALGVLDRQKVADEVKSLDQPARATLRKYGVRFGAYHIYVPALLKPAPRVLATQLWALKHGGSETKGLETIEQLAASGRTSIAADQDIAKVLYRTAGYRVCGARAVRVDILERLADLIRPALAWRSGASGAKPAGAIDGFGFTVTVGMTSLAGCSGEDFASVLRSLGYRAEKRPKPAEPPPASTQSVPVEPPPSVQAELDEAAPGEAATGDEAAAPALALETEPIPDAAAEMRETTPDPSSFAPAVEAAAAAPDTPAERANEPVPGPATMISMPEAPTLAVSEQADVLAESTSSSSSLPSQGAAKAEVATEEFIEVWRPGRRDEHTRKPRRERAPRQRQPDRQTQASAVVATAEAAAAISPDSAAAPAAEASPAPADGRRRARLGRPDRADRSDRPDHSERPPRSDRPERHPRADRAEHADHGRSQRDRPQRGDRPERSAHGDRPDRDPALRAKYIKGRGDGRDRRDREPDPNSPFAKLAALKEQLEANAKERR